MKKLKMILLAISLCILCGCQSQSSQDVKKITQNKILDVDGYQKIKLDIVNPDDTGKGRLVLTYGNTTTEITHDCQYFKESYALIDEKQMYLFIQAGYSNDYITTSVFVCHKKAEQPTYIDTYGASLLSKDLSTTNIRFVYRLDLFGSYDAYKIYKIKNNELKEKDEYYYYTKTPKLTLIRQLPCQINKKSTVLKEKTTLKLIKTDGYSQMYFESSKQKGYFEFAPTEDDFGQSIYGVKETEYFKELINEQ